MKCARCGSEATIRNGLVRAKNDDAHTRQKWKCKGCGHVFVNTERPEKNYPASIMAMSCYIVNSGLSTRDASIKIHDIFGKWVSKTSISTWAKESGVVFSGRARLKGCKFCGSRTKHNNSCPVYKERPHVKIERASYY